MEQPSPVVEQKPRSSVGPVLLAVIITSLIVGGSVYLWQTNIENRPTESQPAQTEQITQEESAPDTEHEEVPSKLVDAALQGNAVDQSYSFHDEAPDGFISLSQGNIIFIEKRALATIYENEESVTSLYAPRHPTEKQLIFISTASDEIQGDYPSWKSTNKIYAYDIQTGDLQKLYEEQEPRLLRTMGMEGSKLILMYDRIDNSPGPCFSVWAGWDSFGYMELADIRSGLRPYTVPSYQIELGTQESEKCLQGLES